jgi:hypothetical protein
MQSVRVKIEAEARRLLRVLLVFGCSVPITQVCRCSVTPLHCPGKARRTASNIGAAAIDVKDLLRRED